MKVQITTNVLTPIVTQAASLGEVAEGSTTSTQKKSSSDLCAAWSGKDASVFSAKLEEYWGVTHSIISDMNAAQRTLARVVEIYDSAQMTCLSKSQSL